MADGDRISVSEDKLYRALGELELRLVEKITTALDKKAEQFQVDNLEERVNTLEASRLSRAHLETDLEKLKPRLDMLERESLDKKAVKRAFHWALGSMVVGVATVATDIFLIVHYIH
jgi:predicted RecB family endonuclease